MIDEATPVPIERLLEYQNVVNDLAEFEQLRLGDILERLRGDYRSNLEPDLARLGIRVQGRLQPEDVAGQLRRALEECLAGSLEGEPEIRVPSCEDLVRGWREARPDAARSEAREAAFDLAAGSSDFLRGLGWFQPDESPHRHQLSSARRWVEELEACGIVADEVGLGKTLVAGLVIFELEARGLIDSCLVLVPSNLLEQWEQEMVRFFDGEFRLVTGTDPASLADLATAERVVMDLDRANREPFRRLVGGRSWGCLVVDEAHRLRNPGTRRANFCASLDCRYRAYLTATPVHNSAWDVYHLVTQLRPGFFGVKADFRQDHLGPGDMIADPAALRSALAGVMTRQRRADTNLRFPIRSVEAVWVRDRHRDERRLYRALLDFLRTVYQRYARGGVPLGLPSGEERHVRSLVLVAMLLLRELASHPLAALATLGGSLRDAIRRVDDLTGQPLGDLDQLDGLVAEFEGREWGQGTHAKSDLLLKKLPELVATERKVIVYAEFLTTLEHLRDRLLSDHRTAKYPLVFFHGSLPRKGKERALDRFRRADGPCLFLSTDCGGEGLNLQVAGVVVNYDFPWNPMRVEQRIGRVDRIGQERPEVRVLNFVTSGTIESYVYAVLEEKLKVCSDVMGELTSPISRLQVRRPEDFGIGALILGARDDNAMAEGFRLLEQEMDAELSAGAGRSGRERRRDVWF